VWAGFLRGTSRELIRSISRPIIGGSLSSPGRIEKADGGYRISGRWKFGSGCQHADVMLVGAVLCEGGKPLLASNGAPQLLQIAMRASEVNILDTWRVTGLRGTGSHDFMIDNLLVAAERALPLNITDPFERGPLYAFPMLASFAVAKGAVALGIARHAIDAFMEIARAKIPATRTATLSERPAVQIDLAHAEAIMHSARAFLHQSVEQGWQELIAGRPIPQPLRALTRLAATDCVKRCADAVDLCRPDIKLATGVCLLPEREPLITAKAVASLDLYSGGRVVLGVGAGWLREETEAMGAHFGTRWKRLRETVEAMRIAWSQPEPSYAGDIVRFPPLRCEP
jgi:alkylation response protein AidB-like acyl-CoA dehydrogenase